MTGEVAGFSVHGFVHDALFYEGTTEFVERVGAFLSEGLAAGEPALVVVDVDKIERLRGALGTPDGLRFQDMEAVGRNPARIIPAWARFVEEHAPSGTRFRGVGEPIWPARTPDELAECERHEALINVAFTDSVPWTLVCPYDVTALSPQVISAAEENHPAVRDGNRRRPSATFTGLEAISRPFDRPLPAAPPDAATFAFSAGSLGESRSWTARTAATLGLPAHRQHDLVLAVSELVSNSLKHGGGEGTISAWATLNDVIFEVVDDGLIGDPLVGRHVPAYEQSSGFGVWLATHVSDLIQIRTGDEGSRIRLLFARD